MKLCKDCKWCKRTLKGFFSYSFAECKAPQNTTWDLIEGKPTYRFIYCSSNRIGAEDCGHKATWFEPRK